MRKIYTTLLVSATIFTSYSALPLYSSEVTGGEEIDCITTDALFTYPDTSTIALSSGDATVSIYPNPVKSFATISFTYQNIDRISIMNIVGREIKSITPESGKQEIKVSLVDLQPGVYFLAAYYQGNTLITKKFLKED